ncbi:MAG: hypothetical protein O8C66_11725 [Candidatus Methanoperedens sp.]|nr:hypothetical protein [Candidatus Methanoperedens sp.]MCZ7371171.1 hypothetical protein [Candidatus Methanoperedens sp.]
MAITGLFYCAEKCLTKYKEIKSPKNGWIALISGAIIAMTLSIILLWIFNLYWSILIMGLAFVFTIVIRFCIEKRKKDATLLKKSERIAFWIIFMNWFIIISTIFTFIAFPVILYQQAAHQNLFNWNDVPGNNNHTEALKYFLKQNYNIKGVETENITKIDDGKTIRVLTENNSILLRLNDDRTVANLTISDGRFDEFDAKMENHELNIYPHISITQVLYYDFLFLYYSIIFLAGAIIISIDNHKYFLSQSKNLLNSKYQVYFPYVRIITNSTELRGKVLNIFDENLIILDNYGGATIKAVEWNSITYLELIQL